MTRALVAHTQPAISLTITINVNADKTLLLLTGIVWLAWLTLARVGRWLSHAYEVGRAAVVVAWRRARRAWGRNSNRMSLYFAGRLAVGLMGVG